MKKNFTNPRIICTLRQVDGGTSVAEGSRQTGITEQTFHWLKRQFAGVGVAITELESGGVTARVIKLEI